ncbi:MAG: amino acid permease [Caulobacterales bacterium]|nr:amino acid permease [Caulobacterales bacterium]
MNKWRIKSLDSILATAEKKSLHRSLGLFQLTMLGIGSVIGTGIFVLTAEAAQKAGPGMMISFIVAGAVCVVAALCYAELASMVPVAGSAYTYSYGVMGELIAWLVGWALILEYALGASAVAVGWSGFATGLIEKGLGIDIPAFLTTGPYAPGGLINLPAMIISILVTTLLVIGTSESAKVNSILVAVKVLALTAFIALTIPLMKGQNFTPFTPLGWGNPLGTSGLGVLGAAASIFFAYVGFDAVSTAAEETKNPQRNVPLGLILSLGICTIFYLLVAAGAIGAYGAQPVYGPNGEILGPGSVELAARCQTLAASAHEPLVCSREALAHVLRSVGHPAVGNLLGVAAIIALPSVVLAMMYGQTRVFFVMARDGLLPGVLAKVHPKFRTPHVVTIVTGAFVTIAAAFVPVGKLADYSNSGTLFAFALVAVAVMILRKRSPERHRPFRTPFVWIVAPLAVIGSTVLYLSLGLTAKIVLPAWGVVGLIAYFAYGYRNSHVAKGITEAVPLNEDAPGGPA